MRERAAATLRRGCALLAACGAACALLAACGAARHAIATPAAPTRAADLVIRIVGGAPAVVMVRGTVAGHRVLFAVDTGSSGHLLAGWAVRRFGLSTAPSTHLHLGANGAQVVAMAVEHANVAVDGWGPLTSGALDVVDFSPDMEELGIAGLLSPQLLTTPGSELVLDLPNRSMSLVTSASADALLAALPQRLADAPLPACALGDGGSVFIVSATVAGAPERLLVDTGSTMSVALVGSDAGQRLHGRAHVDGDSPAETLAGTVPTTTSVRGVDVAVGAVQRTVELELQQVLPQQCPMDGMLGLDVLQDCLLAIGPHGARARCVSE